MIDIIMIALAALIVAVVGCRFVFAYSKWKKVMRDADSETNGEDEKK